MGKVNLFLLLPETEPSNQWMRSTEKDFSEVDSYEALTEGLKKISERIAIENYEWFYDDLNIKNFLYWYDELEDCYPYAPKRLLRSLLRANYSNWREEAIQSPNTDYRIFNQPIRDSSLCEIAERENTRVDDKHALLNHQACVIKDMMIVVDIDGKTIVNIDNLKDEEELFVWFTQNRRPPRNFSVNPKHGENRQEKRIEGGKIISPLRCSREEAQELLDAAIGASEKKLFNFDSDYDEIIVFKYEGDTPRNMYHGYHVPKDSAEVPFEVGKKLGVR